MTDVFAALTGTGDLLLPAARYVPLIGVNVTTFPQGAAVMDTTSPRRVMKVGWIAPGRLGSDPSWPASLFFEDAKWIDFERELITYPAPGIYCDRVRYHLEPGAVATIYVNEASTVPNSGLQPWDRNPAVLIRSHMSALAPNGGFSTLWSYTVPSGKRLWIASAHVAITRYEVASALSLTYVTLGIQGTDALYLPSKSNVVNERRSEHLNGAPHIVPAGVSVNAQWLCVDTGGQQFIEVAMSGFLFDA